MPINQIGWLAGRRAHIPCIIPMNEHCSISTATEKKRERKKEKPNHKLNQINAEKFVSIKRLGDVIYAPLNGILVNKWTYMVVSSNSHHQMCISIIYTNKYIFYTFECRTMCLNPFKWRT